MPERPYAMRLKYHEAGRQFFFITLCLEGRKAVLSTLEEGAKRPLLSPYGELAKARLVALHTTCEALALSNFAIMPDHLHFILIIDYSRFAPPRLPPTVLRIVYRLVDDIERDWRRLGPAAQEPLRFERSPYIVLSFEARQLAAIRCYIALNPQRALWKKRHADMFVRRSGVRTAVLSAVGGRWDAIGNLALLGSPFILHARLTMKKTAEEHAETIAKMVDAAKSGAVVISGFISAGEKALLRALKEEGRARFIKLLAYGLPPRYDPSAEDSRELAAGRMLILSGFPAGMGNEAFGRKSCLALNEQAAAIAAASQGTEGLRPPNPPAAPQGTEGLRPPNPPAP